MKIVLILVHIFFIVKICSSAESNEMKWRRCTQTSECIPVVELCGGPSAINKIHLDDYYQYKNEVMNKVLCGSFVESKWYDEVHAICDNKKCVIKLSTSPKTKSLLSLSKSELSNVKSLYAEIEKNISHAEYRDCFYNVLKLKKITNSFENSENHFFLCLQKIK